MRVSGPFVQPLVWDLCISGQSTVSLAEDTHSKQVLEGSGEALAMITAAPFLCSVTCPT